MDSPSVRAADTSPLARALDVVDSEIEYARDERAAFDRFRARLANVDPTPTCNSDATATSAGATGIAAVSTRTEPTPEPSLREVRTAYRETVMAVPHYESEYADTLRESLATEFAPAVAAQVADGTRLTAPVYSALLAGSESASEDRDRFRRSLVREHESLLEIRGALADCDQRLTGIEQTIEGAPREALGRLDDRLEPRGTSASDSSTGDLTSVSPASPGGASGRSSTATTRPGVRRSRRSLTASNGSRTLAGAVSDEPTGRCPGGEAYGTEGSQRPQALGIQV